MTLYPIIVTDDEENDTDHDTDTEPSAKESDMSL